MRDMYRGINDNDKIIMTDIIHGRMGRRYDLAIFDMDGTLTVPRGTRGYIHDEMGVSNEDSLTAFNSGEIDEDEFIRRDLSLWFGVDPDISEKRIFHILRTIPWIKGIQETVACLHYNDIKCVICSGGLELASRMIANEYDFDGYSGVRLLTDDDGRLTGGYVKGCTLGDKGIRTRAFIDEFGVDPSRVVSIGNSYTDIKMFDETGMSIAFNPTDDLTVEAADHVIRSDNISDILDVILKNERYC